MTEVVTLIRPRAQYLKQLTTHASRSPTPGQLPSSEKPTIVQELKLQTVVARYWLCTQGLTQPQPGQPKAWVVDYITPEYCLEDGSWRLAEAEAYGPHNTTWLQGNDYLQMLTDEYERLKQQLEEEQNGRIAQEMEITQDEMHQVIAQLDAIVQERQRPKV